MLDAGLRGYREKRQFKVALSDVVGTTSDTSTGPPSPPVFGLLECRFDTVSGPIVGLSLQIGSHGHDGHTLTSPYTTWTVSGLESWTDTISSASSDTEIVVELRGERLYARADGLWEIRVDELEIFVDGVSKHTGGPYYVLSTLSHSIASAVPVFGLFPDLSGYAMPYPVADVSGGAPTPEPESSGSISGNVSGGYREYVDGNWVEHPVTLNPRALPSLSCDCEAPSPPSPTISTTWDSDCAFFAEGGRTSDLVEAPFDCEPCEGAGVNRWTVNTSYSKGFNGRIGLIPDFERGIVRLNPDFEAFWGRYALPEAVKTSEKSCTVTVDNGSPVVMSADGDTEVFPEQSEIIEVVSDDVEGSIEDTFGFRVEAPHELVGYAQVNSWTLGTESTACETTGDPDECPTGPVPDYEVKECSIVIRQKLEGASSPPANDIGTYDTGHARGRYVNYLVHPHASFTNWFEPWELNGTPEPWGSYWEQIGQQWMFNSALPTGQKTRRRNDLISDVMGEQVFCPILDTVADPLRYIGVSRFEIVEPTLPASYVYDSDSEDLWSLDNCTASFGSSIVVSPSGPGQVELALTLSSWTHAPYLFAQICKWITQSWSATNVGAIHFYLENVEGTRKQLSLVDGVESARPAVRREPNYAGSYGIDNGNGAISNIGSDIQASGISAATMADEIRCGNFQLLAGWGASKYVIVIEPEDENSDVTIEYPEFRATSDWVMTWESRQCSNFVSDSGPGFRFGNRSYWDSAHQVPPVAYGLGYTWSALDMFSDLNVQCEAKAADDGLSTLIAGVLDAVEGQDEEAASQCRGFALEGLKFAFVNPLSEGPPLALYPRKERDSDYEETGDFGLWTYTIAQKPRTFVHPHKYAHLYDDSGAKVSEVDGVVASGWFRSHFYGQVDNSESLDWEMRSRKPLGLVRPWNGWFIVSAFGGVNPWNAHAPWGHYHRTNTGVDAHEWHRSLWAVPPFEMDAEIGDRNELRFSFDYRGAGFTAVWTSEDGVYVGSTYDDGETLGDGDLILPDCVHPHIVTTQDGWLLVAGFESASGKILAKSKGPGDTAWSSEFYFSDGASDLEFEDDTFAISEARDGAQRLVLAAVKSGEDDITEFYSTDLGETWEEA